MSTNPKLVLESLGKLKTLFFHRLFGGTQIFAQPLSPNLNIFFRDVFFLPRKKSCVTWTT